ncbi:MAG: uracil-DNA glycosylase [Clostridia bacterium]|nr:uracil-DNA glycosylase [Clostridia bacterium]
MQNLEITKEKCLNCRNCSLCDTRKNVVFGVGNESSPIVFVGEAPGENEDIEGIPFVGAAGKFFDKYLLAVDIPRDDVYICNILKCRPPKNRDPKPEEEDACLPWLREQIKAINPKVIICLGRIAASRLIGPDFKITRDHGKWFDKGNFKMCAVYHPSALLRDPSKKVAMLEDMIEIAKVYKELKV